jgi:putative FmdB family regulatory protein
MCEGCGYSFEKFQGITARPLGKCPKCGDKTLKRLIGAGAGVIFKGSGFYETDYRSESYRKAEEGEKKTTDKDTGKKEAETKTSETKSGDTKAKESKPETKTQGDRKDKKRPV